MKPKVDNEFKKEKSEEKIWNSYVDIPRNPHKVHRKES
jgi:hypothetical protein